MELVRYLLQLSLGFVPPNYVPSTFNVLLDLSDSLAFNTTE
jgi:hypothetical protein